MSSKWQVLERGVLERSERSIRVSYWLVQNISSNLLSRVFS